MVLRVSEESDEFTFGKIGILLIRRRKKRTPEIIFSLSRVYRGGNPKKSLRQFIDHNVNLAIKRDAITNKYHVTTWEGLKVLLTHHDEIRVGSGKGFIHAIGTYKYSGYGGRPKIFIKESNEVVLHNGGGESVKRRRYKEPQLF